jgi:hypothetical protein
VLSLQVPLFPFIPALSVALNTFLLGQLVSHCAAGHTVSHAAFACLGTVNRKQSVMETDLIAYQAPEGAQHQYGLENILQTCYYSIVAAALV